MLRNGIAELLRLEIPTELTFWTNLLSVTLYFIYLLITLYISKATVIKRPKKRSCGKNH